MKKPLIIIVVLVLGASAFFLSNALDLQGKFSGTQPASTKDTNIQDTVKVACQAAALEDINQTIQDFEDGLESLDESLSKSDSIEDAEALGEILAEAMDLPDWEEEYDDMKDKAEDAYDKLDGVHGDISAAYKDYKACK